MIQNGKNTYKTKIIQTNDGSHSILAEKYDVTYHSKYGAIQESQHVFIDSGLYYKAAQQSTISILEIGLGTGLNALMTLLESKRKQLKVSYVAYEAFPISLETAENLNYPSELDINKDSFLDIHKSEWNNYIEYSPFFRLCKCLKVFDAIEAKEQFDLIYFDAFSPTAQPELWEALFLQKMYNALKSEGVLVTYCAKGVFKRTLKKLGFQVESLAGPPGKREMTRAIKSS